MIKNLPILFYASIVLLFSCKKKEQKPDIVLPKEKMIEVVTEFQMAEAIIRLGYHRTQDSLIYNDSIYKAVFDKLEITEAQFDTSYSYYSMNPKEFESIYKEVITNLSTRSAELQAKKKEGKE